MLEKYNIKTVKIIFETSYFNQKEDNEIIYLSEELLQALELAYKSKEDPSGNLTDVSEKYIFKKWFGLKRIEIEIFNQLIF